MATITDFETWLDATDLKTEEEARDLITSVENILAVSDFTTIRKKGRFLVTGWAADTLLLVNEKARSAFIAEVKKLNLPDDLDAGFQRNMDNPKT